MPDDSRRSHGAADWAEQSPVDEHVCRAFGPCQTPRPGTLADRNRYLHEHPECRAAIQRYRAGVESLRLAPPITFAGVDAPSAWELTVMLGLVPVGVAA